jgi:hypothetical protein
MEICKTGFFYGTGAAINIELGWVPDTVIIENQTDGDVLIVAHPAIKTMAFTSGGTNEIKAGHTIVGATSGATARVRQVLADTGTWAGGDAAGTLILDADTVSGTFTSESIYYQGSSSTNDATGAAVANIGTKTTTAAAANTNVSAYVGSTTAAKGFTVATADSEDAKLFSYCAMRNLA